MVSSLSCIISGTLSIDSQNMGLLTVQWRVYSDSHVIGALKSLQK